MKKKYLLPIMIIGITVCISIIGCTSDKSTTSDTSVSTADNTEVKEADSKENDDKDSKDAESKSSKTDVKSSSGKDNNVNASNENSKKNTSTEPESSKADNSKVSANKTLSKTEAVNKILAKEFSGQSVPKYNIPVTAEGDGYSNLKKSEGSNAFLCNDDNKLDNGVLVELIEFNGDNESNNFIIRDYGAIKNGGRGMVDKGSISRSGEVILG